MIQKISRGALALGLALGACIGFVADVRAQTKTIIKLGWTTSDGAQDPYAVGARAFKERS